MICFNPSFWLDASGSRRPQRLWQNHQLVSILVSGWMHLEESCLLVRSLPGSRFNPSFWLDASGRGVINEREYNDAMFQS